MDAGEEKQRKTMYAIIKTGGKQYRVAPDDTLEVERLPGNAGDTVELAEVLMIAGDDGIEVGAPFVAGATVSAELVAQTRGDKIIIFKKRRRKHYRRRQGHRQDLTLLKVTAINAAGARKPTKKAAAKPAAEDAPAAAAGDQA
jgi:large subunit ribosomal protein L21